MSELQVNHKSRDYFDGSFDGHDISISKDHREDDFYIVVTSPDGTHAYDGWWNDSKDATIDEAVEEALDGAQLRPRRTGE